MRIQIENRHIWKGYAESALKNVQAQRAKKLARLEKEIANRNWLQRLFTRPYEFQYRRLLIENWNHFVSDTADRILDACSRSETNNIYLSGDEYDAILHWKDQTES